MNFLLEILKVRGCIYLQGFKDYWFTNNKNQLGLQFINSLAKINRKIDFTKAEKFFFIRFFIEVL
jgi:hypothetical protein